jgi:hypothetical protein
VRRFGWPLSQGPTRSARLAGLHWGMDKPLPPAFAVTCVQDRWFAISPSGRPHDRTIDRQVMGADDCHTLMVPDEIPTVPAPYHHEVAS